MIHEQQRWHLSSIHELVKHFTFLLHLFLPCILCILFIFQLWTRTVARWRSRCSSFSPPSACTMPRATAGLWRPWTTTRWPQINSTGWPRFPGCKNVQFENHRDICQSEAPTYYRHYSQRYQIFICKGSHYDLTFRHSRPCDTSSAWWWMNSSKLNQTSTGNILYVQEQAPT